ncbi:MAG: aerobic carbon-monoxide dehydrogenase medium subunit [Gaiellales bacterium]|nr:aerobic carbon-monoxide dehydrogenase medium subunit [Gaiellales bacterium]
MQVPAPFDYRRATSVDDAIALLTELGPDSRVIAGGHSLLPMMKLRLAAPEHLVDINDLSDLAYIRRDGDEIRVGAMTRHRDLLSSPMIGEHLPIVVDAERVIADPLVRNRGTIGGALCQADPSEDISAVCAALGASCVIQGPRGERVVSMAEFHRGPYETAVEQDELLIEVRIAIRPGAGSAYEKLERRAGDWAVAAAGAALWLDGDSIADAGIALTAVGANEVTSTRAQAALKGKPATAEAFAEAGRIAAEDCNPRADQRGPVDYKRHLAEELTIRALRRAAERAGATAKEG